MASVRLDRMTDGEFTGFYRTLIVEYAQSHVDAGDWPADTAVALADKQCSALLSDGVVSPDQYLYTARDGDLVVGTIWFARRESDDGVLAFIYDIRIGPEHRGAGYGSAVLAAAEDAARAVGLHRMRLHVFGTNTPARGLYRKAGYAETHVTMDKSL